jgi:type I restriction enzyme, S subunit
MRIVAKNNELVGYIFIWLNSDYGHKLITRHVYGSVVDEIDNRHLSQVKIPILKDENKQKDTGYNKSYKQ